MSMTRKLARIDDRVDTASLDSTAAHTPIPLTDTREGGEHEKKRFCRSHDKCRSKQSQLNCKGNETCPFSYKLLGSSLSCSPCYARNLDHSANDSMQVAESASCSDNVADANGSYGDRGIKKK